jgi:hypothetical protein
MGVFAGVFEKTGAQTWCFCGQVVVDCVVKLVMRMDTFRVLKLRHDLWIYFRGCFE